MTKQNQTPARQGRSLEQITGGTTSAASMGAGSTGDVGAPAERKDATRPGEARQAGAPGAAGRTDDLLAGESGRTQADEGFRGNRQSTDAESDREKAARSDGTPPR